MSRRHSFDNRRYSNASDTFENDSYNNQYDSGVMLGATSSNVRKSRSHMAISSLAAPDDHHGGVKRSTSTDFREPIHTPTSPTSSRASDKYALDAVRRNPDRARSKTEKEFFKACASGKEKKVEVLLNKDFAHNAMAGGKHLRRVGSIVRMNDALNKLANAVDGAGDSALHIAVSKGHAKVTRRLLGAGAIVDARDLHGRTPLHRAAQGGKIECAKLLLDREADPNTIDIDGMTPLHYAAEKGYLDIMDGLLNHDAKLDPIRDEDLSTPLHRAAMNNKSKACRFLIQHGADLNIRTRGGRVPAAIPTKKKCIDVFSAPH